MKLKVVVERHYIEKCEIEVADLKDARQKIEALTNDNFRLLDSHFYSHIYENGVDVTGDIQATPNIGL